MTQKIIIDKLGETPAAVGEACQLFERVFHHAASPQWWSWKYLQAPNGVAINLVARMSGSDALLGHVGAMVLPGIHAGQALRMAHLTDVMVLPEARGGLQATGTYGQLMAAMSEQLCAISPESTPLFAYGFPGQTPSRLGARMRLYRPLYACHAHSWPSTPGSWLDRLCHLSPVAGGAWPLNQLDSIWDARMDHGSGPTLIKNGAYLQWRYARHPEAPYTLWLVGSAVGAAVGWIVTRSQPSPLVVDVLLPEKWRRPHHWHRLQRALMRASGIDQWASWMPSLQPQAHHIETKIVAVEFDAGGFHPDWPAPQFQPGDTDVF